MFDPVEFLSPSNFSLLRKKLEGISLIEIREIRP